MAEVILFNIAEKILVSLTQHSHQEVVSCWGSRTEFEKLKGTLRLIKGRIRDAENHREGDNSEAIQEWLGRLSQVLYHADDLFDDVNTLACRQERVNRSKIAKKVRIMFSSSNPFIVTTKIAQEIKLIRKALDGIKFDMDGLNLRECLLDQEPLRRLVVVRETNSFVKADSVVGRENDKIKILHMLFDPMYAEEDISVIPIVGFGGLGKTTLAQLIFNDEMVQKNFDIARWACVSEINNQKEVIGKTLRALSGASYHDLATEQIQSKLRQAVKHKKFFLVLDDVWDESRDRWLELLRLLQCGNRGSKLIVTTRSDVVATNVGTFPEAYKLGLLTHEESWNLFTKLAFKEGREENNPNLAQIGREIAENCGNVPLAIKVVGSLLHSKQTEKEWDVFRDTQLSKAKLIDHTDIMPVLKLSYDYLPSLLKPCFAYCSLFPKDHEYEKTKLIHLWMAQRYLEPPMEDIGDQYFLELLRRNFFLDVKEDELGNVISFKMHDLMHDLAQRISGDETLIMGRSSLKFTNRLVHVNVCSNIALGEHPAFLFAAKNLRSLLLNGYDTKMPSFKELVLSFGSLRALESGHIEVIPDSIERLRHLRYLNFSHSYIRYLPRGITQLDNLKTLKVDECIELEELPSGFTKLANLRQLGISNCPFTEMPHNFGRMKSVREMNRFIIGQNNGLDALADLDLRGELNIEYRIWRTNAVIEARMANLKEKKHLTSLSFWFEYQWEQPSVAALDEDATIDEELLLESLQLPPRLKHLHLSGLRGNGFPRWMLKDLPKLVRICIEKCDSCRVLPLFSRLPLLKNLSFSELGAVEYVEEADGEYGSSTYFPALEHLQLIWMQELKSWAKLEDKDKLQLRHCYVFPRLRSLKITFCSKLMTFPAMPNLEALDVECIQGQLLESILTSNQTDSSSSSSSPTLKSLYMKSVELISLNLSYHYLIKKLVMVDFGSLKNTVDGIRCLSVLKELKIDNCEDLDAWDRSDGTGEIHHNALEGLKSLRTLKLLNMPKVELLPDGITYLITLQEFSIFNLKNLTELPQEIGNLSRLQYLSVCYCPKVTSIPQSFSALTCLQTLMIEGCPELENDVRRQVGKIVLLLDTFPRFYYGNSLSLNALASK